MSAHTNGPWTVDAPGCIAKHWAEGGKQTVATCPNHWESDANAARIVACVNACEGIENPEELPRLIREIKAAHNIGVITTGLFEALAALGVK